MAGFAAGLHGLSGVEPPHIFVVRRTFSA